MLRKQFYFINKIYFILIFYFIKTPDYSTESASELEVTENNFTENNYRGYRKQFYFINKIYFILMFYFIKTILLKFEVIDGCGQVRQANVLYLLG